MRILYGVVGEGMGHAIRSRVVLDHLVLAGHEVEIMASSRAADFLAKRFREVHRIHGLHIIYEENRVRRGKTLWSNILAGAAALPSQIAAYFELVKDFRPEVVVTDFESWSYFYAKAHGLPVVSVDNMQVINRCTHPDAVLEHERTDFEIARVFVKSKLPFCDHYIVSSFFDPEVRKEKTTVVPPILRPEILARRSNRGEHVLVYQTAEGHDELAHVLADTGVECRIYGMVRDLAEDRIEGNLRYRPFSEAGFIEDLASARAVIAGGGFTLLSECVYLHKPVLSIPVGAQFEQVLNSRWIEHLGYGLGSRAVDAESVERFLAELPTFEQRLAAYVQDGNRITTSTIDEHLDRAAAGLY